MPGDDGVEAERAAMLARAAQIAAEHERANQLAALPDLATARRDAVDELARALDRVGATAVTSGPVGTSIIVRLTSSGHALPKAGGGVEWGTEDAFREACAATLAHYRAG